MRSKKLLIGLTILVFSSLLLGGSQVMKAQEETNGSVENNASAEDERVQTAKAKLRDEFLSNLQREMQSARKDLYEVTISRKDTEKRISEVNGQISTLSQQLANLDNQVRETQKMIDNVYVQINEKENQLISLYSEIEIKNAAIEHQKTILLEYLKVLYEQENSIADTTTGNEDINIAKILLSDLPFSEQMQQLKYFNILEKQGHDIFTELEKLMQEVQTEKSQAEDQQAKLKDLYLELEAEKHNLEIQKGAKEALLQETRGQESIYTELLEQSKKQQEEILEEINKMRDHLNFIQERIRIDGSFDPSKYATLFSGEKISIYEYINSTKDDESGFLLSWPVNPAKGLSAYFRDSGYAAVFGVAHNAIDIPTPQETIVRAPAEGVVYKVKDNGKGYSYLMLAHRGGFMTVYGHVTQFMVEEGQKVFEGQPIALSGGTPGTKGAGLMTTGAHLHFEVMKGGKYVDPLLYLPLERLSEDLPEKYKPLLDFELKMNDINAQRDSAVESVSS